MTLTRRQLFALLAAAMASRIGPAMAGIPAPDFSLLSFLDSLPPESRNRFVDDAKLLLGWVTDAAALDSKVLPGQIVDRNSGFSSVPGFAKATPIIDLSGRYRVLREPKEVRGYYGLLLGLVDASDATRAVILVNRLFRLPVVVQEPAGLATDLVTNAGLLLGFGTPALDEAIALAESASVLARQLEVPLIAIGQSQAGGTAQLQIAAIAAEPGSHGFVTFNANCSPRSARRFNVEPSRVPGVNFAKDLDPFLGPHSLLANDVGLQIYIHTDGSGSFTPRSSFARAAFHPREHFLDSFNGVSLSAVMEGLRDRG